MFNKNDFLKNNLITPVLHYIFQTVCSGLRPL